VDNIKKYKICVRLPDTRPLTYITSNYEILNSGVIKFLDERNNIIKIFDLRICEIEEIKEE
jgi:hypothetical protein